ncbi:ROK family protein [Novosphingobium sp. 9]|uniref:ROK family protein n=1 Tax=Novosphingobium sp. 9 TaxID=2025349 RepID=UPI0021B58DC2|nr:ROK family protein [Novosphingobium sp. 9]
MHELAGIEMGGTKTIVVLGRPGHILEREEFPTTTPDETLGRAADLIAGWQSRVPVDAVGIGAFGPIRVATTAADYGVMLDTPKPGWQGAPVVAMIADALGVPVGLDTDVNAAALAEHRIGAGQGCGSLVYLTIGTGVGGGILIEGEPIHGMLHPEVGHMRLRRAPGDTFAGACRFHGDCVEGLVSGPALAARFGCHPAEIPVDHPGWDAVAHDLAELFAALIMSLSPQRIVVGGGVSQRQPHLLPAAITRVPALLGDYLRDCDPATLEALVVPPLLGNDAGPTGALVVAERALG